MVWTKIESIILVTFYSKHNQLSLSLFTVNPVAIVAEPYLDGTCVVSSQPTLAAGVEGRSGSVKEWEFQI